jgi:hypothetical protein
MAEAAGRSRAGGRHEAADRSARHDGGGRASRRQRDATAALRAYLLSGTSGRPFTGRERDGLPRDPALGDARLHQGPQAQAILAGFGVQGLAIGRHILIDVSVNGAARERLLHHEFGHVRQTGGVEPNLDDEIALGRRTDPSEVDAEVSELALPASDSESVPITADANTVRFGGYGDAMILQLAKQQRQKRINKQWKESMKQRWGPEIAQQADSLPEEIDRNRQNIAALRGQALKKLSGKGWIPPVFASRMAAAETTIETLQLLLVAPPVISDDRLPEETESIVRGPLNGFYLATLQFLEKRDWDALSQWLADQASLADIRTQKPVYDCAKQRCHLPEPKVDLWSYEQYLDRPRPKPEAPYVAPFYPMVNAAESVADWNGVIKDYRVVARYLDDTIVRLLPVGNEEDRKFIEAYTYSLNQIDRLTKLDARAGRAERIRAVYYPKDKLVKDPEDPSRSLVIAQGIPWQFYLTIEGGRWTLHDFTAPSPRGPFYAPATQADIEAFEAGETVDPPTTLFDQLNHSELFPEGRLYYEMPSGDPWYLNMTEPWTWSDILKGIGLTLGALALIVGSAGFLAPGVIAASTAAVWATGLGIAASAFSIAGTAAEWHEKEELGILTESDRDRMILSIVTDIAGALSLGLGAVVRSAGQAGRMAAFAQQSARAWFLIRGAARGAQVLSLTTNVATAGVATYDLINAYKAIQSQPGLSDEQRTKALQRLVMTGLLTGTLMTVAIYGDVADIRGNMHFGTGPDGRPVLRPATDAPHAKGDGPDAADMGPSHPTTGFDPGFAPPQVRPGDVRPIENPGLDTDVEIKLNRGPDGSVDSMHVEHAPYAAPEMIQLHLDVVRKFTGVRGRITALLARLRALVKRTEVPPLHLQMELYKHRLAASRVVEDLKSGGRIGFMDADSRIADLDAINRRIDEIEWAIDDPALRASYSEDVVGMQRKPADRPDLPDPPDGHTYYVRGDGVLDLKVMTEYQGKVTPMRLEYADGAATGRFTNAAMIEESGVLGLELNARTKKILQDLGYSIDSAGRINRPIGHAEIGDMKALTVDKDKGIQVRTGRESLREQQDRLHQAIADKHGKAATEKFEGLLIEEFIKKRKVALLEGIHDTKVTWKQIITERVAVDMRRTLKEAGMSTGEINRLINGLRSQKGTVKVVFGTRGVREAYNYRSGATGGGTEAASGVPRHHGHPLYLGGSHEKNLLFDLDQKAHDAVHDFFETKLRLPDSGNPPGELLDPRQLRKAALDKARPGAAVIDPSDGSVELHYLD